MEYHVNIRGIMVMVSSCYSGAAGVLMCAKNENDSESKADEWDWLEPPKRGPGRPRCPPGWLTCSTCGFHAQSKKRLRIHERKHDREMKKANQFHYCKYAEHGCLQKSRKKFNIERHEHRCKKKPKSPKTLDADTLWNIISLFPLSNTMAYNFLKMLEKAIDFPFLPTRLREEMRTRLNCCMQFLEAEKVQFKVRNIGGGHPSEY